METMIPEFMLMRAHFKY